MKRRIIGAEVDDIIAKYRSGISTNELMREHHVVKRTISALLKANGVALRRQGFTSEQTREAADLYQVGRSIAWIANRFGCISPTTVARALRKQGVSLRPRPGAR